MERTVAKIAVSKAVYAIDRPYDYLVPEALEQAVCPGKRVLVPFGRGNRGTDGMVLALERVKGWDGPALKAVQTVLDDQPVLDERGIKLVLWLRERCFCTVYDAVKAMLPAGLFFALQDCVCLTDGTDRQAACAAADGDQGALYLAELLFNWGGRGELGEIRAAFGVRDPNPAIKMLIDAGAARLETTAQRGVGDKTEKLAVLAVPAEEAMAQANACLGSWRLDDCELYVTLEPCPMCAGAILNARIPRVFYGARDRVFGACGGVTNLFMEEFPSRPALVGGILEEECRKLLSDFFEGIRQEKQLT